MKTKHGEVLEFLKEQNLLWSVELQSDSLYVKLPEHLSEGSKEK